jgi:hypothetical protein
MNLCVAGRFDAISLLSDGNLYVFKDAYVFKYDPALNADPSYPQLVKTVFRGWDSGSTLITLPFRLDTVMYVAETNVTYFFKDNLFWRSSRLYELDSGYPKKIASHFKGMHLDNGFTGRLDAAFVWGGNGRVYFVEENNYWRYNEELGSVEEGYPKLFDNTWHGLPKRITDAFLWTNGATYFFVDDKYYRFDDMSLSVQDAQPAYPRSNSEHWFGCEANVNYLAKLSSLATTTTSISTKSLIDIFVENMSSEVTRGDESNSNEATHFNSNLGRKASTNETNSIRNKMFHHVNRNLNKNSVESGSGESSYNLFRVSNLFVSSMFLIHSVFHFHSLS